MSGVFEDLSEEECYLYALFQDYSGIDIAEFCLVDEEFEDGLVRAFPMQYAWWRNDDKHQIDAGSRSAGKSMSIRYRAVAFPFIHPGAEMLITAPESVHLQAITSKIENIYLNNRIPREMLASRGNTPRIQQRPTWNMTFMNGGSIKGRIPQRDGKGVKGMHPTWLEADEMQDFPEAGWVELSSTLAKVDGAAWRCHGVTRGVGGTFDKYCSPGSGWTVHRLPAMLRPTWDDEERAEAVMKYGSEENIDFRRNILGLPGDSTAALFVLSRLVRCFFEKTPVWTVNDDGVLDQVCISDVNVGDSVLNGSKSGTGVVLGKIPSEHSSILELVVDGEKLYVTDEHPFFTTRGWVMAGEIESGDEILSLDDVEGLWSEDGPGLNLDLFHLLQSESYLGVVDYE